MCANIILSIGVYTRDWLNQILYMEINLPRDDQKIVKTKEDLSKIIDNEYRGKKTNIKVTLRPFISIPISNLLKLCEKN